MKVTSAYSVNLSAFNIMWHEEKDKLSSQTGLKVHIIEPLELVLPPCMVVIQKFLQSVEAIKCRLNNCGKTHSIFHSGLCNWWAKWAQWQLIVEAIHKFKLMYILLSSSVQFRYVHAYSCSDWISTFTSGANFFISDVESIFNKLFDSIFWQSSCRVRSFTATNYMGVGG